MTSGTHALILAQSAFEAVCKERDETLALLASEKSTRNAIIAKGTKGETMSTELRPTPDSLQKHFRYDSETGVIYWRQSAKHFKAGEVAGGKMSKGYVNIYFQKRTLKAHIVAYVLMNGEYPTKQIDHKDGNKANNAWVNLRLATNAENQRNVGLRADNKSGVKGVYFHKQSGKWTAQITVAGNMITIGRFSDKADAITARREAATNLHGDFVRL